MSTQEMQSKVKELRELKRMAEELDAEIKTMEDTIKAEMTARGVNELAAGEYKVRWKPYTSNRFDTTRFKAEHADMYGAYCKAVEARRFSIA